MSGAEDKHIGGREQREAEEDAQPKQAASPSQVIARSGATKQSIWIATAGGAGLAMTISA